MLRKVILSLFLLVLFFNHGKGQYAINPALAEKIDRLYESRMEKNQVVGASLSIVDNGEIVYANGYGFADRENEVPASSETIYRVGSITKSFTAAAVLQLHHQGKLNYDLPLKFYLPGFGIKNPYGNDNQVLIRDVLSHTSGLPGDIMNGFFSTTPPDMQWLLKQVEKHYLVAPAHQGWFYSNVGYGLLGQLIANTSGMSYAEYLQENILQPLQMTHSFVYPPDSLRQKMSVGYVENLLFTEPLMRDQAAIHLHSNVMDMSKYIMMLLNGGGFHSDQLIPASLLREKQKDHTTDIAMKTGVQYGYGLMIRDVQFVDNQHNDTIAMRYIGHGGDTFAYHADFGYIPELGIGAVILTNTDTGAQINNADDLIKQYVEYKSGLELIFDQPGNRVDEEMAGAQQMKGLYQAYTGFIKVRNPNKVSFWKGPLRMVLQRSDVLPVFDVYAWIFGIIPLHLQGLQMKFVEIDGHIYLKSFEASSGVSEYIGVKKDPQEIPPNWKNIFGKYSFAGELFPTPDGFPVKMDDMYARVYQRRGHVVFEIKGDIPQLRSKYILNILDANTAVSATFGRNTGYTFTILPNQNIYFNGFEFEKQ
ncbi:MAG: serine hydrolase domain-containing protein [Bacteroidales bacterium]